VSHSDAQRTDEERRPFARAFGLIASVLGAAFVVRELLLGRESVWIVAVALTGTAVWMAALLMPWRWDRIRVPLLFVAIACGSLASCSTQVVGLIPAIGSIAALLRRPQRPLVLGIVAGALSLALLGFGALISPQPLQILSSLAALVIVVLISLSRRQYRQGELQQRMLLEEKLAVEQERAEVAALAERSRIARDIHDVLAHSLGGLVLQLDATEALLESGRTEEASRRVSAARGLAAEGLEEARRAVDALRDPETAADPGAAIQQLIDTHRSLGARAELHETGERGPLDPEAAGALRRAAQEVLSNARRHAPGMPTELALDWSPDGVAFRASTALATGGTSASANLAGGGRGLTGLQERIVALGGSATAGVRGRSFVVEARLPRAPREKVDA
jgi:signal transduction histidine kinase